MHPTILLFDSGLGGLTIHSEIGKIRPDAEFVYVVDDALFPYGQLAPEVLVSRVVAVMHYFIPRVRPDLVVIACNTASTLVMPTLRARFAMPFIGTVPAVKPAAELTKSNVFSVLATPGTVRRDYTRDLICKFAASSHVTLVGSESLARLAEAHVCGEAITDTDILAEIAPAFVSHAGKRTDAIVLACTHYPLLRDRFGALAPWPVTWIDPAPAVARQVVRVLGEAVQMQPVRQGSTAFFTGRYPEARVRRALKKRHLQKIRTALIA